MTTMKDVADAAGVSIATVSNVINGSRNVKIETARRVREVIKTMNYRPNRVAKSLATKSSQIIGVLISDISNPFFSPIVRGVEDIASEIEYTVMVGNSDEDYKKAEKYLNVIIQHGIDGMIISPTDNFKKLLPVISELRIPIVLVNRRFRGLEQVDIVETDNQQGAYEAVNHLISLGHSRIALINGPETVSTFADRKAGYLQALEEAGIAVEKDLFKSGGFDYYDSGYFLTREMLRLPRRPTALFVGSGRLSRGAFTAVREAGISLPDELSFITFDDTEWASLVCPPLTAVAQKCYQMGRQAAALLFERLQNKETVEWPLDNEKPIVRKKNIPPRSLRLKPELIVRGSTGKMQSA